MNNKNLNAFPKSKLLSFLCNNLWFTLLLIGVLLTSALYTCKGTADREKPAALRIVTFGGTVTAGMSAKLDINHDCFQFGTTTVIKVRETQTWWAILERILTDWVEGEVEIISSGLAGNSVANGVARLEGDVLSHSPDYVLVMFGMDDALAGVEADSFKDDLEKIVNRSKEEKVNVVLLTPPPISERMTINCTMDELRQRQAHLSDLVQAIRDMAQEKKLPLIDLFKYFLDNRLAYNHLFKGWLPDAVAQTAMAPFVAGELLPLMGIDNYPTPIVCDFRKVYSDVENQETKHNAFTDLAYFKGEFYLSFRSGQGHGVPAFTTAKSEVIIILRSEDGIHWTKDAVFKKEGRDSRDPKFLQTYDGRLIVYTECTLVSKKSNSSRLVTYGFEQLDHGRWSEPFECATCFFWRPKKWRGQYVVAPYAWPDRDAAVKLLSSEDGRTWKVISNILPSKTDANETDLLVENDKLTAFSRTEKGSNSEMLISTYFPDDNRWETVSSERTIHAPNVFKVGERLMITGRYMSYSDKQFLELQKDWRLFTSGDPTKEGMADIQRVEMYHHGLRTGLFLIDSTRPRLVMELLSAGDCSYTGVVQYGNEYMIRDYSMHEYYPEIKRPGDWNTPSDIYMWRVRFGE